MILPIRRWKDIQGYEGKYQISNLGEVRSLNYKRTGNKKILIPATTYKGYKSITLNKNGKKTFFIHRLVAIHFIPNPNNYPIINHKDENPSNNLYINLEWCTAKYNNNYGTRNQRLSETQKGNKYGLGYKHTEETKNKMSKSRKGNKHPRARKVQCINNGMIFNTISEASEWSHAGSLSNIIAQIKGKQKTAGKDPQTGEPLKWRYIS